jgi:hypothetical protein
MVPQSFHMKHIFGRLKGYMEMLALYSYDAVPLVMTSTA